MPFSKSKSFYFSMIEGGGKAIEVSPKWDIKMFAQSHNNDQKLSLSFLVAFA